MKRQRTKGIKGTSTTLEQPDDTAKSSIEAENETRKMARNQDGNNSSKEEINSNVNVVNVEDGQRILDDHEDCDAVVMNDTMGSCEECWPPWLCGVDEQMTWGSIWLPLWDLDSLGKDYDALYSDVMWDEDIWNLKSVNEIPRKPKKVGKN